MSVTHEEIMEQVKALTEKIHRDAVAFRADILELKASQEKTAELVEAFTAFKTGGRFVAWMSKFTAGAIAIWVLIKGGAEFLVELGKQ
jgi:hypothetical protein